MVLSSQRVPLGDALLHRARREAAQAANPLVFEGQKLMPSVTRVFSKQPDLYVFLQAYERGATTMQPLVAFVTFYRGDEKAFETTPLAVTEGIDPKSKAVPCASASRWTICRPGRYDCQVTRARADRARRPRSGRRRSRWCRRWPVPPSPRLRRTSRSSKSEGWPGHPALRFTIRPAASALREPSPAAAPGRPAFHPCAVRRKCVLIGCFHFGNAARSAEIST